MTDVLLVPVGKEGERRYLIRLDGAHAGGITVHSVRGDAFSYGIAIAPRHRRRGAAFAALCSLFELMRADGFARAVVQVEARNEASLALHEKLGFEKTRCERGVVTLERAL